jgi:hypothetical protein
MKQAKNYHSGLVLIAETITTANNVPQSTIAAATRQPHGCLWRMQFAQPTSAGKNRILSTSQVAGGVET